MSPLDRLRAASFLPYGTPNADRNDFCLMRELMNPLMPRATMTPITLATVGLEPHEAKRIAREVRESRR